MNADFRGLPFLVGARHAVPCRSTAMLDGQNERRSVRLAKFDYSSRGFFYVTICTHEKRCTLGRISNYKLVPSPLGRLVAEYWEQIPAHFPNVVLDEWIVMPNHLHGIIIIKHHRLFSAGEKGTACRAPTTIEATYEEFGKPVAGSLPTIVRSFKSAVTKRVRQKLGSGALPVWQRNYFEHVIREESFNNIRNYIWENPIHWETDEYRSRS